MLTTVVLALSTLSGCAADPDGRALLSAHRASLIDESGARVTRYRYRAQGIEGSAVITTDLAMGHYIDERVLGLTRGAEGFDGTTAWMRDMSGFHRTQRGGDRPALAIAQAYLLSNGWWRADRGGARIIALTCDSLRVTPAGGKPFDAWFDPVTHVMTRFRQDQSWNTTVERRYSNHDANGIARRIEVVVNEDDANPEILELESADVSESRGAAPFRMPVNALDDSRLPASGSVELPFRLLNNHVIVSASVNGKGPFSFLVDTGGHNILTPVTAAALGIRSEGSGTSGGSGEATVENGYARIARIEAGGAVLSDQVVLTLDFSPPTVEGFTMGGMLGAEFLERFVVEFDYGRSVMTLSDPRRFTADRRRRAGVAVPVQFYDHMPQVEGTFEGVSARFNIDTGSRSDVSITAPFVERAKLREMYPSGITITDGWGTGGPARSHVVRARKMTFGPVEMSGLIAGLSVAKRGVMADENFEGNVGSGLLKRFVVTIDYSRETIYFRRLKQPDADTSRFDRTGMWLNLAWGGTQVMDVAVDGPAAQAGLEPGDLVTAIGDVKVTTRTLSDVRRLLKLVPVGRPLAVRYVRDGNAAEAMLEPRDLIPD